MKIGEYIKDYRDKMGISQRKFSESCGLSNAFISMLEKDVNPKTGKPIEVSISNYKAIAKATGISLQELFETLGDDAPVVVENPPTKLIETYTHSFDPSLFVALEARIKQSETPKEDAKMVLLWRNASVTAKRAAIAVLESMKGDSIK